MLCQDKLEHVLNPFEQINEAYDINEEGTGLGLSIIKNFTELHGGMFKLKSKVDEGTQALISIPTSRVVN
nr:ATP-binding protein [Pseudemcibacter aquimaris]